MELECLACYRKEDYSEEDMVLVEDAVGEESCRIFCRFCGADMTTGDGGEK